MEAKQNVSVRLSEQNLADIGKIAKREYLSPRTLMRQWILQRLDAEVESRRSILNPPKGD